MDDFEPTEDEVFEQLLERFASGDPTDDIGGDLTDDSLALELGVSWPDARYVAAWGRWFFFDGARWKPDERLLHMTRTRQFMRRKAADVQASGEKKAEKVAARLKDARTIAQVIQLARSNPSQAASADEFDANPWLLATPESTVNLKTGETYAPRPDDLITKRTAVSAAEPGAPHPRWSAFLREITRDDRELIGYLQRFCGYILTGSIREHMFAFGHGTGANGKSVFVNTVRGMLGDYAIVVPPEMLLVSNTDRHPTELARLRGARFAVGSEIEEGKRWAENRIKSLTGGDPIPGRFMRQDFFEFQPEFKLFVIGNHRPSLRGVDEAIRRRLHLVPFTVTIPERDRDLNLEEKLGAEWPAILRWAIDGCLEWQDVGLCPPAIVQEATEQYFAAEDLFSQWLESCAHEDAEAFESTDLLYGSWARWCRKTGEHLAPQKQFAGMLEDRGFPRLRKRQGEERSRGHGRLRLTVAEKLEIAQDEALERDRAARASRYGSR